MKMQEGILLIGLIAAWFVLNRWVLPAMGVGT